jgi:protoporphyrinogen oxidase
MKIAIIGAGFTGLTAALRLLQKGHEVTVFEKDTKPGGLAIGYKENLWKWTLEQHYHHWFTNDHSILGLAKELNFPVIIARPKSSFYVQGESYQLDTPTKFLTFPKLSLIDRIRMVASLGALKINFNWRSLEGISANKTLPKIMGEKAYNMLWRPQLENKMGKFADEVSLVWFWSRIAKRTPSLAYPQGGFLAFAEVLTKKIQELGGKIIYDTDVQKIEKNETLAVSYTTNKGQQTQAFENVLVTLPTFLLFKLAPQLPEIYKNHFVKLKGLSATNMVIRLKKKFLTDNTYWLSICEKESPVMVVVEHTNFMDSSHYNNEHLLYIGNYATTEDKLDWPKEKLLAFYHPLLNKIHPDYKKDIIDYTFFTAPFAQPIVPKNYSRMIPPFKTPIEGLFLANMQQVYPWDRGTNYAVELGEKVAKVIAE